MVGVRNRSSRNSIPWTISWVGGSSNQYGVLPEIEGIQDECIIQAAEERNPPESTLGVGTGS